MVSLFLGLQETQLAYVNDIKVDDCWDLNDFGHNAIQASGSLGGILSMWDSSLYNVK